MKLIPLIMAFAIAGCAADLPPAKPINTHHHNRTSSLFKDYTGYKPVVAGDWRALNREVAPQ